jgi:hypothetical protein
MTLTCKKPAMRGLANGGLVGVPSAPPRWCITKHQRDNTSTTGTSNLEDLQPSAFAKLILHQDFQAH